MKYTVVVVLISCFHFVAAQAEHAKGFHGPITYIAFCGPVPSPTANLEFKILDRQRYFVTLLGGFWYAKRNPERHPKYMSIPVGMTIVKGRASSHRELGFYFLYNKGSRNTGRSHGNESLYFSLTGGYRYQRPEGGFFFRAYLAPAIKIREYSGDIKNFGPEGEVIALNFGLGIGYAFNRRNNQESLRR